MPRTLPSPSGKFVVLFVTLLFLASAILLYASTGVITSFNPLGAIRADAAGINATGTVVGTWIDSQNVSHGYMRTLSTVVTVLDDPDDSTQSNECTFIYGINDL